MTPRDPLTPADVRMIAAALASRFGGSPALRDPAALEQALLRPHLRAHPDAVSEAAALLEGFALHRPFAQGNHRVMIAAADVFLRLNAWRLSAPPERIAAEVVQLLRADAFTQERLEPWLRAMAVPEGR